MVRRSFRTMKSCGPRLAICIASNAVKSPTTSMYSTIARVLETLATEIIGRGHVCVQTVRFEIEHCCIACIEPQQFLELLCILSTIYEFPPTPMSIKSAYGDVIGKISTYVLLCIPLMGRSCVWLHLFQSLRYPHSESVSTSGIPKTRGQNWYRVPSPGAFMLARRALYPLESRLLRNVDGQVFICNRFGVNSAQQYEAKWPD